MGWFPVSLADRLSRSMDTLFSSTVYADSQEPIEFEGLSSVKIREIRGLFSPLWFEIESSYGVTIR
jgi:hypothetical protein